MRVNDSSTTRGKTAIAAVLLAIVATICGCGPSSDPPSSGAVAETRPSPTYRIAYNVFHDEEADDYEVFIMELDGSRKRNLTEHPAVDWVYTAHGDRMFMVSDRDDEKRKYHLYEMGPDGGEPRRMTEFRVRDSWLGTRGRRTDATWPTMAPATITTTTSTCATWRRARRSA